MENLNILTKLSAFICRICPLCIVVRRFPDSEFAKKMKEVEKSCPCCKAYTKLKP